MEEEKQQKTETAAEAVQKAAFVKVCHDMRTPLSSIMYLAQMMEREEERPEKVHEYAEKIAVSAEYLLGLADDIVDIYKLGSGRMRIEKKPFSPYELAGDIQKMLCPQIKDTGHELTVCVAETVPAMLTGDKRRLERILLNLLANAVKHAGAGGKTALCISCAQSDDEKLRLVFTVSDDGAGMEQSILDAALIGGRPQPNAGLGIAIAKGLTELMGGSITAESGRGEGTVFRVELAFDTAEKKEAEADAEGLAGKRLLLAEDDRLCREILRELLENETGRPVSIAENGLAALKKFESSADGYDAVIMDVQMPVMNGYEAAQAIRMLGYGNARTVPIIALTADESDESARAAADAGMNRSLPKSACIDSLRRTVAATLKNLPAAHRQHLCDCNQMEALSCMPETAETMLRYSS